MLRLYLALVFPMNSKCQSAVFLDSPPYSRGGLDATTMELVLQRPDETLLHADSVICILGSFPVQLFSECLPSANTSLRRQGEPVQAVRRGSIYNFTTKVDDGGGRGQQPQQRPPAVGGPEGGIGHQGPHRRGSFRIGRSDNRPARGRSFET